MKTVATFMTGHEAHFAKGILESEGIHAVVIDENTSATVLYSPAIGGVKVQVPYEDYDRARGILGYGQASADIPPQEAEPSEVCPQCGSSDVSTNPLSPKTILAFIASLFANIPVHSQRKKRVCRKCGTKW